MEGKQMTKEQLIKDLKNITKEDREFKKDKSIWEVLDVKDDAETKTRKE